MALTFFIDRMLEGGEDPLYVARRLVVVASEDVGLADPQGLPLVCILLGSAFALLTYRVVGNGLLPGLSGDRSS